MQKKNVIRQRHMIGRALEIEEIYSFLFLVRIYSVIIASVNFDRINDNQ